MIFNEASLNEVHLLARFGQPAKVRQTQGGMLMANFSVVTQCWSKKAEANITTWHRIVAFGYIAEMAEKTPPGSIVMIIGRLQSRKWCDTNGIERHMTEIVAESYQVVRLPKKNRDGSYESEGSSGVETISTNSEYFDPEKDFDAAEKQATAPLADDDIPF